jgi:hypothetical protein
MYNRQHWTSWQAQSKAQLAFLRKKAHLLERQSPAEGKVESGDES